MKPSRYLVEHVSSYKYDNQVQGSLMLLRLRPRDDGRQRVLKFNLHVDPYAALTELEDPFGNRCHLFNVHRRHGATVVHSRVRVEAADAPPLPEHPGSDGWKALEAAIDPVDGWEFLEPSRYVRFSDALEAFTSANDIERGADPLSSLMDLSARLHRVFQYDPGSTAVDSPMEHILETGRGVCQDYTHVMLAIARSWGVPGRYVSGYIHREGREGEQSLPGASHCWGEFFIPDAGWVGIDPTNDTLADHRFVAVAVGRDYADACPTRGTVLGGGGSTLEVKVTVTADDETAPDWSPHREWPNLRAVSPTPHEYSGGFDQ
ncbi:MAG: transglutaminase family protein [Proteobacteria bacterium]|nr:transglutaminase family protein [Pseudomonadota bacterium]MYK31862.1 transglutaminase family protein [Boseongicola sp. SB0670_bin_30]